MGFPYEGPTPLEAIANGMTFINPKFEPPLGRRFSDKRANHGDILENSNFFLKKEGGSLDSPKSEKLLKCFFCSE